MLWVIREMAAPVGQQEEAYSSLAREEATQ